ncbi:MAG: hypothetical protein ACLT0Y_00705 [Christensenellales bacterium]
MRTAQSAGISRINLDMIYALPTQTLSQWTDSLSFAMDCGIAHLSAYALSIEPNTPLYQDVQRGYLAPPEEDFAADCYDAIAPTLAPYGLSAYEISNFAAPGQACRHNLLYWRRRLSGLRPAHSAFPAKTANGRAPGIRKHCKLSFLRPAAQHADDRQTRRNV